ncbi:hypothetical protein C5B96_16570 [Subtercola sp. Z020]|nr:hypothetical protein C5B96_16570 [Subtercola sp. Z020]
MAAAVLGVEAVALAIVRAATGRRVLLPVDAWLSSLGGRASGTPGPTPEPVQIAVTDLGVAVVVLCVLVAVARALEAAGRTRGSDTARWVEFSVTASVTVFLVAQLNGVQDVTTLVLVYAATSGMALFGLLQQRVGVGRGHPKLALCFGAGLGIVPWGVVAFQQIGAGLVGDPPSVAVRVITLVMLAFAGAFLVAQWRVAGVAGGASVVADADASADAGAGATGRADAVGRGGFRGERMHVLLSAASTSVFAWLVVLGLVLPN